MKENKKKAWKLIPITIFLMIFAIYLMNQVDANSEVCARSEFNRFSNSTQASRYFNECYVDVYESYESTEECGLFGISCYERNVPSTKHYRKSICFNIKTGEIC